MTPFIEDQIASRVNVIGAERVLFRSDWPHPEAVAEPVVFLDDIATLSAAQQKRMMSDNLRELLRAA